jgi:hypothetical protein
MPVDFGKADSSKGRPLSVMAYLRRSIVEVVEMKADKNCLAHSLIAAAKVTNDRVYKTYVQGRKILPKVYELLRVTGIDLSRGGGIPELRIFQHHLLDYRIVVYSGQRCDIIFDGQVATPRGINLSDWQHYHVITNLTAAMAKCGCPLSVTKVIREARSTGVMRPAMPARPFLPASRTTLGFPATRGNSFWTDPVGDLVSYTFKFRPWADRIVVIAHNAKTFYLLFVLNRLVRMKMLPEILIMNGQKIICLKVENVT